MSGFDDAYRQAHEHADPLLATFLDSAIEATMADFGTLQLVHRWDGSLRIAVQRGFDSAFLNVFRIVKYDRSACSAALARGGQVVVRNVRTSPHYIPATRLAMIDAGALACQSTPIVGATGNAIGMISTHFRVPHRPTRDQLEEMRRIAQSAAAAIEGLAHDHGASVSIEAIRDDLREELETRVRRVRD